MKLTLVALAAIAAGTANAFTFLDATEMKSLWSTWKQIHNKSYNEAEEMKRFAVFTENYMKVVELNAQNDGVKHALNHLADLSAEEFERTHLGYKNANALNQSENNLRGSHIDYSILGLPDSVDWRQKGAVTPVKDQAQCGSCWAFSTTGSLEGLNFVKSGKLLSFSEQQLVSCVYQDPDTCDDGGLMDDGFKYVIKTGGIETEQDYPYVSGDGRVQPKCTVDKSKLHKVLTGYKDVPAKNADALKAAIAAQPVSVAVDARTWQFYKGGVLSLCPLVGLNHGVLAVGYGTQQGKEAYIIKNSWSAGWGNQGYLFVSTDAHANNGAGVCGILNAASYPTA